MKENGKKILILGSLFIVAFTIWTMLIQTIDVKSTGINGTDIGFSTVNNWFHKLTGVHISLYVITDWLGLVPIFVCMILCLSNRESDENKNLLKVFYIL